MKEENRINKIFLIVLFVGILFDRAIKVLFEPMNNQKVKLDILYEASKAYAIIGAIAIIIISIILTTYIIKTFWNRFLSSVFNIRQINYTESMAVALIVILISR